MEEHYKVLRELLMNNYINTIKDVKKDKEDSIIFEGKKEMISFIDELINTTNEKYKDCSDNNIHVFSDSLSLNEIMNDDHINKTHHEYN